MKVFDFKLGHSDNITYDLIFAIRKCKEENYDKLIFEKGVYEIDRTYVEQRNLNISNHGLNGPKRIAVLIEDMEGFEIDFNGSTLLTRGNIIPIVIRNSKNITIKNLILENPETQFMQARVDKAENGTVEFEVELGGKEFFTKNGALFTMVGEDYLVPQSTSIEFNGNTGEIEYGTGDFSIGFPHEVYNEFDKGNNRFIVRNAKRLPPVGNVFIHTASRRLGSGIFCENCAELSFNNVTVHSCLGMALIAQFCHNVSLDGFSTVRKKGQYYTANADATHFVHCTGVIKVENGLFEGQLDDALNIHGVFVRVIDKVGERELLVKQSHYQATGLNIFDKGDKVQALKTDTLLPYAKLTVDEVVYINDEVSKVIFKENINEICVGDDLENLTKSADLIFRNNKVQNNRARGMLIANKGYTLIENNYFHTSGSAILFESDGKYWFESGGTNNVVVRNNNFDRCVHGAWGNAVIEFAKRDKTEKDRYYHGKVQVVDNIFTNYKDKACIFDNIQEVIFKGNKYDSQPLIEFYHCGKIKKDV